MSVESTQSTTALRGSPIAWDAEDGEHRETDAYYRAQWRAYALRRGLAVFFVVFWPFVVVGLFFYSRMVVHLPFTALGIMFVWLVAAVALVFWAGEFRCPRCRRRYGALGHRKGDTNLTRGLFDRVCANCKLRKFEKAH